MTDTASSSSKPDRRLRQYKSTPHLEFETISSNKSTELYNTLPTIPFELDGQKDKTGSRSTFTLRAWSLRDVPARAHHRNNPDIQYYLDAPDPYTIGDALQEIIRNLSAARRTMQTTHAIHWPADLYEWEGDDEEGNSPLWFPFAIANEANEAIGEIRMLREDRHRVEIVYWMSHEWRGRGVMAAAIRALIRWVFETMEGVERVEAWIAHQNVGSVGVARKAGMLQEGLLSKALWLDKSSVGDQEIWTMLRTDFEKRRQLVRNSERAT